MRGQRADLLRLLGTWKDRPWSDRVGAATRLGFEASDEGGLESDESPPESLADVGPPEPSPEPEPALVPPELEPVPLWRIETAEPIAPAPTLPPCESGLRAEDLSPGRSLRDLPDTPEVTPWSRLEPRLAAIVRSDAPSHTVDLRKVVARLAKGEVLDRLPRATRHRWPHRLHVVLDRRSPFVTLYADQIRVLRQLAKRCSQVTVGRGFPPPLPPHATLLVVGDANALRSRPYWRRRAAQLGRVGVRLAALVADARPLRDTFWHATTWERRPAVTEPEVQRSRVRRLLRLGSVTPLLQPGLLRALRLLLPADEADLQTELQALADPTLVREVDHQAVVIEPALVEELREEFEKQVPADLQHRVWQTIAAWHEALPVEVGVFDHLVRRGLEGPTEGAASASALDFVRRLQRTIGSGQGGAGWRRVARGFLRHLPVPPNRVDPQLEQVLGGLSDVLGGEANATPVAHPVVQVGSELRVGQTSGSIVGTLYSASMVVVERPGSRARQRVTPGLRIPLPSTVEQRPEWAVASGRDRFGRWAEAEVEGVRFRMRWVPPGRFLMGSPPSEPDRFNDERLHEVEITRGYWLAAMPVTQALWRAVMQTNPSKFEGDERPVEQVSWHEAREFCQRLTAKLPGLGSRLPTEAEWEKAARSGRTDRGWATEEELREIAWFEDNSDMQTHPVAQKQPNAGGFHDMLGNVYEWCLDAVHSFAEPLPDAYASDPLGTSGSRRVFRGGSWNARARRVRAAYRYANEPGNRYAYLGFRVAGGPAPGGGAPGPGRDAPGPEREGTEPSPDADVVPEVERPQPPTRTRITLRSRFQRLTVAPWFREPWVTAAGRDRFGLWSEVDVQGVRFRMRWIPPGRFMMGSPPSEAGRYDDETLHPVHLTRGYWLGETPVTQDLWQALMGTNPSRFVSPGRPVEQVSWEEAMAFCKALGEAAPGLSPRLPTEAEWEHACRAGTETTTWVGDLELLGRRNAPLLDAIAWYSGNSGVEFDLDDGYHTSMWFEAQYDHTRAGTHPVRTRQANPWGLYDMLGNVYEWCLDQVESSRSPLPAETQTDPLSLSGSSRVIRGGSWRALARSVRAAARRAYAPGVRYDRLGFRVAGGPAPSGGAQVAGRDGAVQFRAERGGPEGRPKPNFEDPQ
ncbi:MAG: formylglycine-generating enzyme family protein [Myxococcota bacterium]